MNEKGNLSVSMAVVIIAVISNATMAAVAFRDALSTRMQFDALQETHFLRYQSFRGLLACQTTDYSGEGFTLPTQQIELSGTDSRTTYFLKTKIAKANVTTGGGYYTTNGYTVKSLITAKRGGGSGILWSRNISPVKKYAEKDIHRSTFAGYHYFTNTEASENSDMGEAAGRVYFWGPDVIYGKVHSNSDIWIEQGGSTNNGGWPTFFSNVSTAGVFQSGSGTIPYENVFRDNYFEHVPRIEFPDQATEIQAGPHLNIPDDPNTILRVHVDGTNGVSWLGHIVPSAQRESIDVYAAYPPPTGPELFHYYVTRIDTVWTPGPSINVNNSSIYIPVKTWLEGSFQGKQTWGCKDTLYLIGNIKLQNTTLGMNPDGNGIAANANPTDFVGLVSEKRIIIKYGIADPMYNGSRRKDTCGSDAGGIWIYAALCALGDGDGNPHKDGVFTFEYQAPHPSTPDRRIGNTLYTKIDLHTHIYPQTSAMAWPGILDYPWYNPLWPERLPNLERGTIHLYGSVAQRRRGFVHRSTTDPANHNGTWDFANYKWGDISTGVNCAGASGAGVGYKKDYHFDNRFSFTQPPNFPEVHALAGLTPFESESWKFKKPPSNF